MREKAPSPHGSPLRLYVWVLTAVGLLLLVGSGVAYLINQAWGMLAPIGASIGLVLLLSAILLCPHIVRAAFTRRQARYASNAVIKGMAFIGILGLINFLAIKYEWEYDLTETGHFTLSEQTIRILEKLDRPVEVIGFFKGSDPRLRLAKDYLERYSHYTDYLNYEFHDPETDPILAQKYDLSNYGLVFVSGDNQYKTSGIDERMITSGLVRVTSDPDWKIYFVTGHGEHSLTDTTETGFSKVKQTLEREGYIVESINLATSAALPPDTRVVVVAGANRDLLDTEVKLIEDWLATGGKLMVLTDSLEPVPFPQILLQYGLLLDNGFVVEDGDHSLPVVGPDGLAPKVIAPLIYQYPHHEITRRLNGTKSFYPLARSISMKPLADANISAWPLLTTSPGSWVEINDGSPQPKFTPGTDLAGPLHLAVAVEDYENKIRLVVFGNTGFVTNQNVSAQWANMDLFINSIDWLAEEEDLISIRRKQPANRSLFLTSRQIGFTTFTTLIAIPAVALIAGLVVWWKRR